MPFNPSRLVAPQSTGSSAVAQFASLGNQQLNELGSLFGDRGRDERTDNVARLIGSGALQNMSEPEARSAIAQVSQGDVGKQMSDNINTLLLGKSDTEKAKILNKNQVDLQNIRDVNAMSRTKEQTAQSNSNQFLNRELQRELTDKTLGAKTTSPLDKLFSKNVAEQFSEGDFSEKKRTSLEGLYDKDNYIFDAEFTEPKDKQVMNQIMFEATNNPTGRKVIASNDPEAVNEYVRSVLESRGQYLDEGLFGSLEIKQRDNKESNFLSNLFK